MKVISSGFVMPAFSNPVLLAASKSGLCSKAANPQGSTHPKAFGDWLAEAGFTTGAGVTVKITEGCIVLMADCNEVQELREQLYQVKQVVEGMKALVV